ncbi:MAG: methyl-accepting chemotaxis protein, partial [Oscillospiraceae bacterium]|nr:methyl-accepting chemotaxis protein [Oscillospiraceae bacterium]
FKGAYKYASYYVNDKADYILVITVDSDELLSAIDAINGKGLTGLGMAFVFSVVVIGILVSIIVVAPILKIAELTGTVADMDFSENRIQKKLSRRKDEIGLMARSMGSLTESLSDVITNIHRSCSTLLASAEVLQSGAARTTKSMQQVGSAVNDISASANNQARDAQEATSNVVLIGDMIESTTYTVNALMESISAMNEANENAKEVISALREISTESESYIDTIAKQTESTNESVLKISEATGFITDIASQTTLLSMNASIEAARAGEQGRGFAAVASEIKKLAVQSSESANTIIDIIQTLLSDSEKAMATMKRVREIIGRQTEYIVTTGSAFEKIRKGVEETLGGMENISQKTGEMDSARQNVVGVVNNLSAIAEENAAATEQSATSVSEVSAIVEDIASKADELNAIAEQLESQISVFRL